MQFRIVVKKSSPQNVIKPSHPLEMNCTPICHGIMYIWGLMIGGGGGSISRGGDYICQEPNFSCCIFLIGSSAWIPHNRWVYMLLKHSNAVPVWGPNFSSILKPYQIPNREQSPEALRIRSEITAFTST